MENYTPEPNNGKKENLNNNKAGLFKTIGLAASVALFGGTEVVAKDNVSNPHNIHTEKVTSDNIDHLTNNPNAINFFRVSKSIDAVKYFENISDSISPESKKVITEQFVEQILKEINNDNFLEIMKLDWVIYAGDNGWTNTTPLHALAFKEIINKAKANIKNFEGTHLPKNRINIIVNKEIKIEIPNGGILPPTMFKKLNGDYYKIDEIDKILKKHPNKLEEFEKCSEILEFGFYSQIGDEKVPKGKARNTYGNFKIKINNPCNCGSALFK